ncbi:hypothetical protein [Caldimonas sp. KR1-144]|uniref:hypothetical protein n=1 Tax=Caldimonas sp. KR1-144 TaxID=3400911 RepID=UPI003C052698
MRRSGFKRPAYQPPMAAPLRVLPGFRLGTPVAGDVVAAPKSVLIRSEDYRRFVASFPCFWCGVAGYSQCAHDNFEKGMALKVCDTRSFPLCGPRFGLVGCHTQFDLLIEISRDERRALGAEWVERMRGIARAAGRPEVLQLEAS